MMFDFHNDILTADMSVCAKLSYIEQACKYTQGMILALWTSKRSLDVLKVRDVLAPYVSLTDALMSKYNVEIMYSIEDINIKGTVSDIADLPFWSFGIVHNVSNQYAGACGDSIGLSDKGVQLVHKLIQRNKIIDLAHSSKRAFFDIIDATQGHNIVCSHTCFDSVCTHIRNLDHAQCKAIVDCNGFVGLTLVEDFLGGAGIDTVIRHIDWFVSHFGCDNICIGTDYFGTTHLDILDDYDKFGYLAKALIRLGYAKQNIRKIFVDNLLTFVKRSKLAANSNNLESGGQANNVVVYGV